MGSSSAIFHRRRIAMLDPKGAQLGLDLIQRPLRHHRLSGENIPSTRSMSEQAPFTRSSSLNNQALSSAIGRPASPHSAARRMKSDPITGNFSPLSAFTPFTTQVHSKCIFHPSKQAPMETAHVSSDWGLMEGWVRLGLTRRKRNNKQHYIKSAR